MRLSERLGNFVPSMARAAGATAARSERGVVPIYQGLPRLPGLPRLSGWRGLRAWPGLPGLTGAIGLTGLVGLTCLGALPVVALADEAVAQGTELVVTANRLSETAASSLSAVRVITAEDLAAAGQMSLPDVLRQYGGVEVTTTGGPGQPSSVSIRGGSSTHTLVLVDGLRINSATSGTTAIEHLPVSLIDHIEIVPGPLSGLYGSDAVGGTIQIFTRGAQPAETTQLGLGVGSYDTQRGDVFHAGKAGALDYSLAAGYLSTAGFSATNPAAGSFTYNPFNLGQDPYRNLDTDVKLGWTEAEGHHLQLSLLRSRSVTHFDAGAGGDNFNRESLWQSSLRSDDQILAGWTSRLQAGVSRDHSFSGGAFPGFFETDQRQASWQNTVTVPYGRLIGGLEYQHDQVVSDTAFSATERSNRALFAGYAGDVGAHGLRANLRREDNSQFGGVTSGSLGYGYRFSPVWRVRASYGAGFHAPTFNDLYYPGFSNPALQPEHSRNHELGVNVDLGEQHFVITAFDNRVHDLIVFVVTDPATFAGAPFNVASARTRGLETSYAGRVEGLRLDLHATWQDPVDAQTGLQLQRSATRFASARASTALAGWQMSGEIQATGPRFDSPDQQAASRMGGYALLNLVLGHRLGADWHVDLRWNNVLDHAYTLAQGYNTAGSNVFATLTWQAP